MYGQAERQDITERADRFATWTRSFPASQADLPEGTWRELFRVWVEAGGAIGTLPDYANFDILNLPARHWANVCLTKLIGSPRREFSVVMIGSAIEAHNGFYGNNRLMRDLPVKNRHVMRREFAWTLRHGGPVLSEGPYIGALDYVRSVRRLITPYRISAREYAFIFCAFFEPYPEKRSRL